MSFPQSAQFSLATVAAGAQLPLFKGAINGFQIVADPRNRGAYPLKCLVRGAHNEGQGIFYVTGPSWNKGEFSEVTIEALNTNDAGDWFFNFSTGSAFVFPVAAPVVPNDLPAAIGGGFAPMTAAPALSSAQKTTESQALTRAAPTLITEGIGIVGASAFAVEVEADALDTVTGGSINIWRWDTSVAAWFLFIQGIALPTGVRRVAIPLDQTLLRNSGDRLLAATSGVTINPGVTGLVTVYTRIQ